MCVYNNVYFIIVFHSTLAIFPPSLPLLLPKAGQKSCFWGWHDVQIKRFKTRPTHNTLCIHARRVLPEVCYYKQICFLLLTISHDRFYSVFVHRQYPPTTVYKYRALSVWDRERLDLSRDL